MAPVLCTSISTKQSLLGMGWTITSLMSLVAFITAAVMAGIIYSNANSVANRYNQYNNYNYNYNNNNNNNWNYYNYYWNYNNNNNNNNDNQQGSGDREGQMYQLLASVSSYSIIFVGIYTAALAMALTLFGGNCVVGFMSLSGDYIPPSWTGTGSEKVDTKFFGIFIGALVLLSNLFFIVAVVLGEFQISGVDERQKEEIGFFAVERTAAVLATIFMSLSVTYLIYSIVVFSFKDEIIQQQEMVEKQTKQRYQSPKAVFA
jgi:predicted PurR-regulated permease PerM